MSLHKYYTTNIRVLDVQFIHLYSIYDQYFHHLNKNSQILEIGPGNGGFCVYLRNKFWLKSDQFTLIDLSVGVINALSLESETQQMKSIHTWAIEFLQNTSMQYDTIILRHVLEHFPKDQIEQLIALIESKLSLGGKCFIEVPNLWNGNLGTYMYFQDFSHFTPFTAKSLTEAVEWNSKSLNISIHNTIYPVFCTNSGIKNMAKFAIGAIVEVCSALASTYTLAYGNTIFTPRMVGIITKK